MTAAILSLIGTLLGLGVWLWKRRSAKADDPVEQHRKAYENIEKPVPKAGSTDFAARLAEYERLRRAKDRTR